jgi:anti-sigma factor RsiW
MPTANDIHELVAPYALDALDESERAEFERHLAGCDRCTRELQELQGTAAALAWGTASPPPPEGLRERILERARGEAQVVPLRRRRGWVAPALGIAAAAAACIAVGLGLWAASLSNDLDRERDLSAAQARALEVVGDPAAKVTPLKGASGSLVVGSSGRAALVICGLDPAPSGQTYEAWLIRGTPTPAGLFDTQGSSCTAVALDRTAPSGSTVAVTREPEKGSELPTTDPIFSAQFT